MAFYAIGNPYVINGQIATMNLMLAGLQKAMFDELAERSLMSPLAGTKHTYARLAIVKFSQLCTCPQ